MKYITNPSQYYKKNTKKTTDFSILIEILLYLYKLTIMKLLLFILICLTISCSNQTTEKNVVKIRKELRGKGSIQEKLGITESVYNKIKVK